MAEGNRFYFPKPSFFDEFSKGVGLGLSMRQASDRAKQIELDTQKQKMVMGELQRQRGVEDTMRTYAQGSPAQYAEDPGMTAEAQANPDFAGSGFTPLSVGQETAPARPQPTLREIMEFGVRAGASPGQIKSIGDAIAMTQKTEPGEFGNDPNFGPYYKDPSGKITAPPSARVQQDRPMNVGPGGAVFDPKTGEVLYQNQAARGRPPADIVNRTYAQVLEDTGDAKLAEEAAATVRKKLSAAGATGTEEAKVGVRGSPEAAAAAANVAAGSATGRRQIEAEQNLVARSGTNAIISEIEKISDRMLTTPGGVGRFITGGARHAGAILQTNEDAANLTNLRESYSNILSRSTLAEKGVLTEQDRKFAINSIPGLYDSKNIAKAKIQRLKRLNAIISDAEQQFATGKPFDVPAFRRRVEAVTSIEIDSPGQTPAPKQTNSLPPPPKGWK